VVGAFALVGCIQILGIEGTVVVGGSDGGSGCGLVVPSAQTCQACLDAHCCGQLLACANEPACASYEACIIGCGADYVCRAGCVAQRQNGNFPEIPQIDACLVDQCESACGVTCGVVVGDSIGDAAVACQACVTSNACGAAEACGRSAACGEVAQCVGSCDTFDCKEACQTANEAGAALLQSLQMPVMGACAKQCAFGESWTCVGKVDVPTASSLQTVVTLTVTTLHGAVVPDATVKACLTEDRLCAQPLDTATTDAHGVATLTVRTIVPGGYGFGGYFDVAPADVDAQPAAIVPFLYFLSHPLSEPAVSLSAVTLVPSDLTTYTALGGVQVVDAGPTTDLVLVAFDCALNLAPGVRLQATGDGGDLTSQLRYIAGVVPSTSATATDTSGVALLFEVPALENIDITSLPTQLGHAAGTFQAFARVGTIAIVPVAPN
jgi:hypothetical protein